MSIDYTVGAVIPNSDLPAVHRGGRGRGPAVKTQAAIDVIDAVGDIQPDSWVVVSSTDVTEDAPESTAVKSLRNITVTLRKRFPAWRFQQRKISNEEGAVVAIALLATRKADEGASEDAAEA